MKEELLKIIKHFGVNNQQRKLQEEVFELNEAIIKRESIASYEIENLNNHDKHIKEEIADVMILLEQIKLYYGISNEEITKIFLEKVNRTLERIESGYYE